MRLRGFGRNDVVLEFLDRLEGAGSVRTHVPEADMGTRFHGYSGFGLLVEKRGGDPKFCKHLD